MKLFTLITFLLGFAPHASFASAVAYDETSSSDAMVPMTPAGQEPQLTATEADLSRAHVVAVINKSPIGSTAETMRVYIDGIQTYEWKVSTGREQVEKATSGRIYITTTPIGYYRPTTIEENHYSQTWKANMPHAVFFNGGIAAHATTHLDQLGTRASGGCVREAPENAEIFFDLVKSLPRINVQTIDREGKDVLDSKGNPVLMQDWDVLIIVENHA